jgi:hypothetical protein
VGWTSSTKWSASSPSRAARAPTPWAWINRTRPSRARSSSAPP